jgi:hypothetical protein
MDDFIVRWQFTRSETIEILKSLTDERLQFKPEGEKWQPMFHQFGCIGRTQLIYAKAAETGVMDFSLFGSSEITSKDLNQTVGGILAFLEDANSAWIAALRQNKAGVQWPDDNKRIELHITSLAEHERLHHGQLVTYFTLAGFELPAGFKNNWAL